MRAHQLRADQIVQDRRLGWIVAHDVRASDGKRVLRKGGMLDEAALEALALAQVGDAEIHVVEPEPGDLHEDEAGRRLARAVAGDGVRIKGPAQSRYNLIADRKGVLRVERDLIRDLNRIPGVAVFTHLDRQVVLPGKIVAGVKVTPLTVPEADVVAAERLVADRGAAVSVTPFAPKRVAVLATEGLSHKLRERFAASISRKIGWYGSTVSDVRFIPSDAEVVADTMREFARSNDIILVAGGNTIDPLDPAYLALDRIGAEMIHFGAPSHPGSMFWLARVGDVPIFNLASCSMYSTATFADLILPLVMTGEEVTEAEIDEFGYGGLLEREMAFRFPPYDAERSDEEDE